MERAKEAIVAIQHATEEHGIETAALWGTEPGLSSEGFDDMRIRFVVVCSIVKHALKGRVAPVCFAAFDALNTALNAYVAYFNKTTQEVGGALQRLVPLLIEKMDGKGTDDSPRVVAARALTCIMHLADATAVGGQHLIAPFLSQEALPACPRLRLQKDFREKFGLNK